MDQFGGRRTGCHGEQEGIPRVVMREEEEGAAIACIASSACSNHSLLLLRRRLSWERERVLWIGLLKSDPQECLVARLPCDSSSSSRILRTILDYSALL
eukprot:222535-Hanusia_phi.AAC.5